MISSEPQIVFSPNLVWLCGTMSQSVVQKNWFTVFNVKVTARAYIIKTWLFFTISSKLLVFSRSRSQQRLVWSKYDSFYNILWTSDPFATKLCLVVHYHKPEYLTGIGLCSRPRSKQNFKMSMNVCLAIFWITEPFTTKLGLVMYHHEKDYLPKKISLLSSRWRSQWRLI